MMRWGFPPPPNLGSYPVTNVRNLASPYWRGWLKREWRCLVPATSFSEYTDTKPKTVHWFGTTDGAESRDTRPLFAFAGIWRPWTGLRGTKANPVEGEHLLFSFLTTEPNDIVRPIHAKAMPVILTGADCDLWLEGETAEALVLQRPFPADRLRIVSIGPKQDGVAQTGSLNL
jgi:putative SOS response-associated peptidase YedK